MDSLRRLSEADEAALERSIVELHPIDPAAAASVLLEAKEILDELGVVFYLEEGTCLGAIRDGGFIAWDDDVDIASVFGLHVLTERAVEGIAAKFREHGFITKIIRQMSGFYVPALKSGVRLDWHGRWVVDGAVFHFPGVRISADLLTDLKEIDFIGDRFLVPSRTEEFLRMKYGPDWMTPKPAAYVENVVRQIPDGPIPQRGLGLARFARRRLMPWRDARFKVLDENNEPVAGADVVAVGVGRSRTNGRGYARLSLPRTAYYALVVRYRGHEEVLYEERLAPGGTYVYRPDSEARPGRIFVLTRE